MFSLNNFVYKSNNISVLTDQSGNILFDAANVCAVLGHSNASMALKTLDDDEKALLGRDEFSSDPKKSLGSLEGGAQQKWFVYEPGLYKLIFRSQKQAAKEFTRFVAHEVLPAIRKTGQYAAPKSGKHSLYTLNREWQAAIKLQLAAGRKGDAAKVEAAKLVEAKLGENPYHCVGLEPPKIKAQPDYLAKIAEECKTNKAFGFIRNGRMYIYPQALRELIASLGIEVNETLREMRDNGQLIAKRGKFTRAARTADHDVRNMMIIPQDNNN